MNKSAPLAIQDVSAAQKGGGKGKAKATKGRQRKAKGTKAREQAKQGTSSAQAPVSTTSWLQRELCKGSSGGIKTRRVFCYNFQSRRCQDIQQQDHLHSGRCRNFKPWKAWMTHTVALASRASSGTQFKVSLQESCRTSHPFLCCFTGVGHSYTMFTTESQI